MRKSPSKQQHYKYLSSSPKFRLDRWSRTSLSHSYSNREFSTFRTNDQSEIKQDQAIRLQPVPNAPKSIKQRSMSNLNFLRIGCPSHTIVHVPKHVASLLPAAQKNLQIAGTRTIDDLIQKRGPGKILGSYMTPSIRDQIYSVKLPYQSFSNIKRPKQFFELTRDEAQTSKRSHATKSTTDRTWQPDEIKTDRPDVKVTFEELFKDMETVRKPHDTQQELQKAIQAASLKNQPVSFPTSKQFMLAVKTGNLVEADALIIADKRVINTIDSVGQTALHWAAIRNDVKMANLLLQYGMIDIDHTDSANRTALYVASLRNNSQMVQRLLESKADPTSLTLSGKQAIDVVPNQSPTRGLLIDAAVERFTFHRGNSMIAAPRASRRPVRDPNRIASLKSTL